MPFTVADFHDLIRLLEEHPDWQTELRRVLFSQDLLDLPRTVQELATAQRRTEEAITRLTERMQQGFAEATTERHELRQDLTHLTGRVEQGFANAAEDRQRIRTDMAQSFADATEDRQRIRTDMAQGFAEVVAEQRDMRRDIGQLKGLGREQFYRDRAAAIFGRLLVQGYDATNQVADRLQEARQTGMISDRDYQEALAADLLWGGQMRDSRQPIVLVLEASWTVGHIDVERAASRAAVLRQAGLRALPVAAVQEWPPNMQDDARGSGVAIVQDGTVDQESWEAALTQA
jgi:rubrerythrin